MHCHHVAVSELRLLLSGKMFQEEAEDTDTYDEMQAWSMQRYN